MKEISTSAKFVSNFTFETTARNHKFNMDTPAGGGADLGPTPKELVLSAILGCSGMDIVAILRKNKISFDSFECTGKAPLKSGHPEVFTNVEIKYIFKGTNLNVDKIKEAAQASMTKYCAVSAMIAKNCPIAYEIIINDNSTHKAEAKFQ